MQWKLVPSLEFGYNDAENYRRRENKQLFNRIFIRASPLEKLCSHQTFFLVGEKGTGKTAYAVFLSNNNYENTLARLNYIRETDYQSFVALKRERHLLLSDYTSIWKVILFVLLARFIDQADPAEKSVIPRFVKLRALRSALDDYANSAFAPEILNAFNFVKDSSVAAELISKHLKAGGKQSEKVSFSESRFQTNLQYIENQFRDAFQSLRLSENRILFIDGIDIRPASVPYVEYLECIKGLANAIWSLNNDFFPSLKDSKGRCKIVLLVRPDIFASLGLQNQNTKIRDNSVLLDWRTNYEFYRTSELFLVADRLLAYNQHGSVAEGYSWDHYFPYAMENWKTGEATDSSFISFLRFSFWRPRDIVTMLNTLKENFIEQRRPATDVFTKSDFDSAVFRRKYADYLLGEIKDHLAFYYTESDYELFLKFFEFLKGRSTFDYEEYCAAFVHFETFLKRTSLTSPDFC